MIERFASCPRRIIHLQGRYRRIRFVGSRKATLSVLNVEGDSRVWEEPGEFMNGREVIVIKGYGDVNPAGLMENLSNLIYQRLIQVVQQE